MNWRPLAAGVGLAFLLSLSVAAWRIANVLSDSTIVCIARPERTYG